MEGAEEEKLPVRFQLFSLGNNDTRGLLLPEGTIIFQALGFPQDLDDCTCIPVGPVTVLSRTNVTALDPQWYRPAPPVSRSDIPSDLTSTVKVKDRLCHQRRPDSTVYVLSTLAVGSTDLQTVAFAEKAVLFRRSGHTVELDLSEVPDEQRFTLTAEWSENHLEVRVTWIEGEGMEKHYSGCGVSSKDIDSYVAPQVGKVRQYKSRKDIAIPLGCMSELSKRVDRLTVEHLSAVVRSIARDAPFAIDTDFLRHGLAVGVLRFFFGDSWVNENAAPMQPDVSREHRKGRRFLKTESTVPDEQVQHEMRVISLAELVFNLQVVEGTRERVALMENCDLESALGELECAALLSSSELEFRFVTPTGVKGHDYEAEIKTPANRVVCCEIKTKSENTEASEKTISSTFKTARKQLPSDKPGMVLMKIPESWVKQPDIQCMVHAAVERIFRNSKRIVAIVFLWEELHAGAARGPWCILNRIRDYRNERSPLYEKDIEEMLSLVGRSRNPLWVSFSALVDAVAGSF